MSPAWPNLDITGRVGWAPAISRNGIYGICAASASASLRLDVGCQDHLAPFHGLVGDKLGEIGGLARQHRRGGSCGRLPADGLGQAGASPPVPTFVVVCGGG